MAAPNQISTVGSTGLTYNKKVQHDPDLQRSEEIDAQLEGHGKTAFAPGRVAARPLGLYVAATCNCFAPVVLF